MGLGYEWMHSDAELPSLRKGTPPSTSTLRSPMHALAARHRKLQDYEDMSFDSSKCVPEDISATIPLVRPGASGEHTRHPAYYQESISWRGHPPYCSLAAIARSLRSTNCETSPSFCNPPTDPTLSKLTSNPTTCKVLL